VRARARVVMEARNLDREMAVLLGSMTRSLECAEVERRLWEYLDGALPPEELRAVRAHLGRCGGCAPACQCCRSFLALVARALRSPHAAPDILRLRIRALLAREV
jgi:anti-sigma factor RsiW